MYSYCKCLIPESCEGVCYLFTWLLKKSFVTHFTCSTIFVHSPHQSTPLHWAAHEGHMDIVRYFVDKDADINIKDRKGVRE